MKFFNRQSLQLTFGRMESMSEKLCFSDRLFPVCCFAKANYEDKTESVVKACSMI